MTDHETMIREMQSTYLKLKRDYLKLKRDQEESQREIDAINAQAMDLRERYNAAANKLKAATEWLQPYTAILRKFGAVPGECPARTSTPGEDGHGNVCDNCDGTKEALPDRDGVPAAEPISKPVQAPVQAQEIVADKLVHYIGVEWKPVSRTCIVGPNILYCTNEFHRVTCQKCIDEVRWRKLPETGDG